jgi:hypothetical protein
MPLRQIIDRRAADSCYWFSRQPSGGHIVCRVRGELGNRATAHGASIRVVGRGFGVRWKRRGGVFSSAAEDEEEESGEDGDCEGDSDSYADFEAEVGGGISASSAVDNCRGGGCCSC